jgi:hypothetical protein
MSKVYNIAVDGRVHDGFQYVLDLADGRSVRVADSRAIDGLWAAIKQAKAKSEDVTFSGAREAEPELDEESGEPNGKVAIGPLDGQAIYPATAILGLRYNGTLANLPRDAAYETAQAIMEAQVEAQEQMASQLVADGEEEGEEEQGNMVIPAPGMAPMAGADDGDEDEVG